MTPTVFGKSCMGDRSLVSNLKNTDRSPNLRTIDKIVSFIAEQPTATEGTQMATKKATAKKATKPVKAKAKTPAKKKK